MPQWDVLDDFATDTFGTAGKYNLGGTDWLADAGALTNAVVAGGVLDASANLSTSNRFIHTGTGHSYGDVSAQIKHTVGTTLTSYVAGVILKRIDASNYIIAYVDDTGAASRIRIDKVVAGVTTNMASTALTRLVVSTAYYLEAKIVGNVIIAEHWTISPTPMGTDSAQATDTMDDTEAALFGAGVEGKCGIVWTPIQTASTIDDFRIRPFTYREQTFPTTLILNGTCNGTHDSLVGVSYTGSGGTAPTSTMYAWWPKPAAHNYIWNGSAEVVGSAATGAGSAYGWAASTVAGVITAATSITRVTSNVITGTASFEIITPATTDTGAVFTIRRRGGFRKGVKYTVAATLRAASGTTLARVKLGVSGDIATSTAAALSTTATVHTTTWTPATDTDLAYMAVGINAATATTFQFDGAMVYEGTTQPSNIIIGGFGPGFVPGASYNAAQASITGTAWSSADDSNYLLARDVTASGALTTLGNLDFPILPHLFTPDDYTQDEIDVKVFARLEVASTQTSLNCAISMAPERGTSFGARRYGSNRSGGKTIKLPSSGTVFKLYDLGTITLKVNKNTPRREWLRLSFTNSGAATGTIGVDYIVLAPSRSTARSRSGSSESIVPDFINSTSETTKSIGLDSDGRITGFPGSGNIIDDVNSDSFTPDDGIGGESIKFPCDTTMEFLVFPHDQVIDLTDSSASGQAKTHSGSVHFHIQPQVHLLNQG